MDILPRLIRCRLSAPTYKRIPCLSHIHLFRDAPRRRYVESKRRANDTIRELDESALRRIYRPLDPSNLEIRILHVDTERTDSSGRVSCQLEHASLSSKAPPSYEAISWCWGDPKPEKEILLNGHVFPVSRNAEQVLRRLCFDQGHHKVWLDALCIDQSNIKERAEQVAIMKDVYSRAERVLIWLGEDDDGMADAAFEATDTLAAHCRESTDVRRKPWSTFQDVNRNHRLFGASLPPFDRAALFSLFASPIFHRLWILQEVILGKEATCYHGNASRPWADVSLAAQWLRHHEHEMQNFIIPSIQSMQGIYNAAKIWHMSHRWYRLLNLLIVASSFKTTLSLDKVYALLGLWQERSRRRLEMVGLQPDYNAKVEDVYMTATRQAIDELEGLPFQLDLLRYAQYLVPPEGKEEEDSHRPSWVPRYDWAVDNNQTSREADKFGIGAANGLKGSARSLNHHRPRVLSVQGVAVANITKRGRVLIHELLTDRMDAGIALELLTCRSTATEHGIGEEDFAVTMTSRRNAVDGDALHDNNFQDCYRACMFACDLTRDRNPAWMEDDSAVEDFRKAVDAYRRALWQGSRNCRFFVTGNGGIGMGPRGMVDGDVVCVLFGLGVPVILCPEGDCWRLVGNAYVHGIMEGEFVQSLQDQDRLEAETRWFDIH